MVPEFTILMQHSYTEYTMVMLKLLFRDKAHTLHYVENLILNQLPFLLTLSQQDPVRVERAQSTDFSFISSVQ